MKKTFFLGGFVVFSLFCFASDIFVADTIASVPAFPGAEGFGMYSVGGRGGAVYEVNNLNDSGPGSLRAAVQASGPRTVVFRVSGTIALLSTLQINNPYITIAGQTAPGDGICLKDYPLIVAASNVIIRYIRVRLGDNITGNEWDTVNLLRGWNIILDHCSASWSVDETLSAGIVEDSINTMGNLTVQWCIISEGLNCSVHPKGCHGYGSLVRGDSNNGYTYHHNLYAHNVGRNPRPGNYLANTIDPCGLIFDFRNNVIYNYGGSRAGNNDDGQNGVLSVTKMNFIGNYYKRGTNSTGNYAFKETTPTSRVYFSGNWHSTGGYPADPWTLVQFYNSTYVTWTPALIAAYKLSSPVPVEPVTTDTAVDAYSFVLADAGVTFPVRDTVDARVVNEVITGTGSIIDDEDEVGSWPVLASGTPPADTDHDGMPDEWELAVCLDLNNPSDANSDRDSDGYTNVEEYLNWLPSGEPMPANTDINCDNIVNFYDFSEFAQHWSASYGEPLYSDRYDFSHNDEITIGDLFYIAQDWLTAGQEY